MKELAIYHAPGRVTVSYRAEESAQPQQREAPFDFQVSDEDRALIRWYLEEYLQYPWGEWCNRAAQAEQRMAEIGAGLFEAVFGSRPLYALYSNVAGELADTNIVIHASDPAGIALPWELMRDTERGEYGDLARQANTFTRSQPDLLFDLTRPPAGETFNILMIICRPGGDDEKVPFQSVARPLLELFQPYGEHIHLDVLRPPTFEQLAKVLAEKPRFYHVLHFDGHGDFPDAGPAGTYGQTGPQGQLLFEDENGQPRTVTGTELGKLLAGKGVPVVLLNACRSGMALPESPYPSVGNQLLKAGVRGVVAMAYSVYVQTATRYMARLYEGLMNGEELGRAASLAREDLCVHPLRSSPIGEVEIHDWVVPVMFQAARVIPRPRSASAPSFSLDPSILKDQLASAGLEVGCPEPPAFGFVGRDSLVLELERAFQNETIVVLEGMAGVGKTEASVAFARWRARTGALEGPVFFFRFTRHLPLSQVLDRIGEVFNQEIRERLNQDWRLLSPGQRRQIALTILKSLACFLIFDNFEPVAGFPAGTGSDWTAQEQQELREFLSALRGGKTKVLVTSRRDEPWLGPIYRNLGLPGLTLVESQELAVRVLRRAGLDPADIRALNDYNALLQYLRGSPLSIQIILPELKRVRPDDLLNQLQEGEVKLAGDDPLLGREHSLTASLTYRLDGLDEQTRKRLGVLALYQGFVDADVLRYMCEEENAPELLRGLESVQWTKILDAAAEVGLLRKVESGYYTVHPALPWFFHDLFKEAFPTEGDWLRQAYCAAYASYGFYLDDFFDRKARFAQILLMLEENNFRNALRMAIKASLWDSISGIITGLHQLFDLQGRWVEWNRILTDLEREMAAAGPTLEDMHPVKRRILFYRIQMAHKDRDFDHALEMINRLLAYYQQQQDEPGLGSMYYWLGLIAEDSRRLDEAEEWFTKALELRKKLNDEKGQVDAIHNLGIVAQERHKPQEARDWYLQNLEIQQRLENDQGVAQTLHELGNVAFGMGDYPTARDYFFRSLKMSESIGDENGMSHSMMELGVVLQEMGELDASEHFHREGLRIAERMGDRFKQCMILHELGNVAAARGHFEEAERWCRQCLALKQQLKYEYGVAKSYYQLGTILTALHRDAEALQALREAEAVFVRLGENMLLVPVRDLIARLAH